MNLTITKNEKIFGWIWLPVQFLVLPFLVALVCVVAGIYSEAVINLICFAVNAVLALVFFRSLLRRSLENTRGKWKQTLLIVLKGLGLHYLISYAVAIVIVSVQPEFANVNDANINGMLGEFPILMSLAVIFAAPLAEECLFRGWMFTGLAKKSVPLAYCVTCGVFAVIHIVGYIGTADVQTLALCLLQYLAPGAVLCWACKEADSLTAPLILHMSINAISCLAMALS